MFGSFDRTFIHIGYFHRLDSQGRNKYVLGVARLLKQDGTYLIWAMNSSPTGQMLSPSIMKEVFGSHFELISIEKKR